MMEFVKRTSRYTQVGVLCAVLNNLIVFVMDHAGYQYVAAVCAAFALVTLIGYLLHSTYTFGVGASRAGAGRTRGSKPFLRRTRCAELNAALFSVHRITPAYNRWCMVRGHYDARS